MSYILIIEPNTLLARSYAQGLRHAGHEVRLASGAQSAITAADERKPDVVLLELQLPAHNGVEFLQEFRSYIDWREVPVVINTVVPPSRMAEGLEALKRDYKVERVLYKPQTTIQDVIRIAHDYAAL